MRVKHNLPNSHTKSIDYFIHLISGISIINDQIDNTKKIQWH
jgi:hypothetical protein